MKQQTLATYLLNAVWENDTAAAKRAILKGADPSWCFNDFPILVHATHLEDEEMVQLLIDHGATQIGEALGYALENGIGSMVLPLAMYGAIPESHPHLFGDFPSRYAPAELRQYM